MSPFRIIGLDKSGNQFVLAAMLSTNKDTGTKRVHIIQKVFLPDAFEDKDKALYDIQKDMAYAMATKSNSAIVGTYSVNRTDDKKYMLRRMRKLQKSKNASALNVTEDVSDDNRTLFDCQKTAMEDYCGLTQLDIISIL